MFLIQLFMVVFMIEGMAYAEDWTKFNSSVIVEVTRPDGVFTSTGVAISNQTIVTAAHSLDGEVKKVRVFLNESYNPKSPALEVKNFTVHPDYNPKKSRYLADVAKINLKEKLPASIVLYPIYTSTLVVGNIYRLGFGRRNKKNNRTVITPTFKQMDYKEQIVELNDKFSMSGDSGGPVFLQKDGRFYIMAIHSTFSHGPQGEFSYNPLLAPYLSWIYQN
jgi:V8-like Glu-specific endopeptidase